MLAIIDGDVLAYQACRPRHVKKAQQTGGVNFVRLDASGKQLPLEFTPEEDRQYLEESWDNFKRDLDSLLDTLFCTEFLMAVKGENNFRNAMYPEYKINRHPDLHRQNLFVPTLRSLAVAEDMAVQADGGEADDLMRTWAVEAAAAGDPYIVCTIDKDLRCIPGKHFRMKKLNLMERYSAIPDVNLYEISEWEALRYFYRQLLTGDGVDHVPGIPGVGPKTADKLLEGCASEEELRETVLFMYRHVYGDDWRGYLLSNGKMLYLQRHPGDYFSLDGWPDGGAA
jgi:hypothetical protein